MPLNPKNIPNFTLTKNPDVVMGKHGVPITRAEFEHANKNGYAWKDFNAYANYVGGWAKNIKPIIPVSPYYRQYGNGDKINGGDVAMLASKEPLVQKILSRTISKKGEVPQLSPEDGDLIKGLINREKTIALSSSYPFNNNMVTATNLGGK